MSRQSVKTGGEAVSSFNRAPIKAHVIAPSGVRDLAVYLSRRYGKPLYNTEFGFCRRGENDMTLEESLDDWERTVYIREHTEALKQAIKEGADVRGCMTWSEYDRVAANHDCSPRSFAR